MLVRNKRAVAVAAAVGLTVLISAVVVYSKKTKKTPSAKDSRARVWPLPDWPPGIVQRWQSGARSFGAVREEREGVDAHIHAGVDLGPPREEGKPLGRAFGSRVLAPVSGRVEVVDGGWEGSEARRIEIVSPIYGRIVLGGVQARAAVREGQWVKAGQLVGWLGRYPGGSSMLHLEQHRGKRTRWLPGQPQPAGIIDPRTSVLEPWMKLAA